MSQDKTAEQLRASSLEDVVAFLLGEGELDGVRFGEKHERRKDAFWWREYLREAFEFGPIAWESTTPAYFKYITQAKYEKFSPAVRQWYKPYRCTDCENTRADSGEAVAYLNTYNGTLHRACHNDNELVAAMIAMGELVPLFTHPPATAVDVPSFQAGVSEWMSQCFIPSLYSNMTERGDRLLEEVLELLQAHGYDESRVTTLVNYVYGRPVGEPAQEVGGVMVTLAGYCWIAGLDMHAAGDAELARITKPEVMAKIRAKQEAKNALHFDTPLPGNAAIASREWEGK